MIKTLLITENNIENIKKAADILKRDGLVVFPTETVYGLGANAFSENAVNKIFKAKGRPSDNPLIVHINSIEMLKDVAEEIPDEAYLLFKKFSPGPLTIILKKNKKIPKIVTAGLNSVAVRIPSHKIALDLIKEADLPLAAPSANISGRPSPTNFEMAVNDMYGKVDAIIDGGNSNIGLESTVIKIEGKEVRILRPGGITEEDLKNVLSSDYKILTVVQAEKIESPGMKYQHYKPEARVILCDKEKIKIAAENFKNKRIGFLLLEGNIEEYYKIRFKNLTEYAHKLYFAFYEMDKSGVEIIIAEKVDEKGIGKAIMNRLLKASGGEEFTS